MEEGARSRAEWESKHNRQKAEKAQKPGQREGHVPGGKGTNVYEGQKKSNLGKRRGVCGICGQRKKRQTEEKKRGIRKNPKPKQIGTLAKRPIIHSWAGKTSIVAQATRTLAGKNPTFGFRGVGSAKEFPRGGGGKINNNKHNPDAGANFELLRTTEKEKIFKHKRKKLKRRKFHWGD